MSVKRRSSDLVRLNCPISFFLTYAARPSDVHVLSHRFYDSGNVVQEIVWRLDVTLERTKVRMRQKFASGYLDQS